MHYAIKGMADTKNGDQYKIKNIAAILRALEA
jgi:hypothetical protein